MIYVDGNGSYTESEARTILRQRRRTRRRLHRGAVQLRRSARMAAMAAFLPVALLGDQTCESLEAVNALIRANAVGAVSVKLRRTGLTELLKIIALCEAAGIPVVIGTDSREPHRRAGAHASARGDPLPRAVADRDAFLRQARRRRLRRRVPLRRRHASRRPTRRASARRSTARSSNGSRSDPCLNSSVSTSRQS